MHARHTPGADDPCRDCSVVTSRRSFVGRLSAAAVAAMVGMDVLGRDAEAVPVSETSGTVDGEEISYPVPTAEGVRVDREQQVLLVNYRGKVYAFNLSCPHENTALRWRQAEGRFQCPRHESKYTPDGTFTSGRATRNMDRFAIRRAGGFVFVNLAKMYRSDQNAAEWAAAAVQT